MNLLNLRFAHLCFPKPGERQNGDAVLVRQGENGRALLAVIDGLGHGPAAAEASRAAVARLNVLGLETSVLDVMLALHDDLRPTRGAAATVCSIQERRIEVCAVGNVQLMSVNCVVPLVLSAGVLGQQVRKFRVCQGELRAGSRLALLSDGVSTRFRLDELRHLDATETCKTVMDRHRRKDDDATVLIADLGN